ncbi:hypothetical protein WDU94_014568 [Cyamophila willieti]
MSCKLFKTINWCQKRMNIDLPQGIISIKCFSTQSKPPSFGLIFDIDGVLVRGKAVLPGVSNTFKSKLTNQDGKFVVPTVFVTNAGNSLAADKAKQLSEWLGVEVREDQVVMSHTPIKMLHKYHQKHTFISGQGPMEEIAKRLGFNKVATVDNVRSAHPLLDCVDHRRRVTLKDVQSGKVVPTDLSPIEAIAVIGEPVRWETNLQLIIDLLLTNGNPNQLPASVPYPHIPVIASNMDLLWMSEANIPRFGHGTFLVCLESLYKKITGYDLKYDYLVGKPCELTYQYAVQLLLKQVQQPQELVTLYGIGDNINTDIFGANLYHQYLSGKSSTRLPVNERPEFVKSCLSVLVKTGVFNNEIADTELDHSPRDLLNLGTDLRQATYICDDVNTAIDHIFQVELGEKEGRSERSS